MACIFRIQNNTRIAGGLAFPGYSGHGDIGSATDGSMDPTKVQAYLDFSSLSLTTPSNRTLMTVRAVDMAIGGNAFWSIVPDPAQGLSRVSGPWSMRFYYRRSTHSTTTYPIFRMYDGGTQTIFCYFTSTASNNARVTTASALGNPALSNSTGIYRIEVQADPSRTPTVVCRVYNQDETTAISSWSYDFTATWTRIDMGHFLAGNYTASTVQYGDIEIHDDYDLGGQFTSSPSSPTAASTTATGVPSSDYVFDSRFNYNLVNNRTDQEVVLTEGIDFTKYTNVPYVNSGTTYGRNVDIYVPNGTPPAEGWPVLMWAHSGFFVEGSKAALPLNWRDDLLNNGYAIASVQYLKSSIDALNPYDDYGGGGNNGGRYPSHIIDYKRASAFIRDNVSTYSLNPNKIIASGFSAGGYIALGAFVSRGLSADSDGNPMTLAAASLAGHPWADSYSGPDPEFAGSLVYAAPIDMDVAVAFDPTDPNVGRVMSAASRAFQGLIQNGTTAPSKPTASLQNIIALNESNILRPIAYVRGTADYLVHWEHQQLLRQALEDIPGYTGYTEYLTPNEHDHANDIYDRDITINWLNSVPALNEAGAMFWTPSTVLY